MNRDSYRLFGSIGFSLLLVAGFLLLGAVEVNAQCAELAAGLRNPLGITQSEQRNLFVSETGTGTNDGRISILDRNGVRTFVDGLPSAINDVGEPAGPAGLVVRKGTLYVLIGVGDAIRAGAAPGTTIPNPTGPSTPIFSSILAIHFSEQTEKRTGGFTLSPADYQALAEGRRVRLSDAGGRRISIELVANFPDFLPAPLPDFAENVNGSNPFDLGFGQSRRRNNDHDKRDNNDDRRDRCERDLLYVSDGGQNHVWQVEIESGAFSNPHAVPSGSKSIFS